MNSCEIPSKHLPKQRAVICIPLSFDLQLWNGSVSLTAKRPFCSVERLALPERTCSPISASLKCLNGLPADLVTGIRDFPKNSYPPLHQQLENFTFIIVVTMIDRMLTTTHFQGSRANDRANPDAKQCEILFIKYILLSSYIYVSPSSARVIISTRSDCLIAKNEQADVILADDLEIKTHPLKGSSEVSVRGNTFFISCARVSKGGRFKTLFVVENANISEHTLFKCRC